MGGSPAAGPPRSDRPLFLIVASSNPVKGRAAAAGCRLAFPGREVRAEAVAVPSGVAEQPFSEAETLQGARARVLAARAARPEADLWIGIEGGVEERAEGLAAFAWVVAASARGEGLARSATFLLPPALAALVRAGVELGEACDRLFGRENSKQADGAVGLLTGGAIDRRALYEQPVVLALIPLREPGPEGAPG